MRAAATLFWHKYRSTADMRAISYLSAGSMAQPGREGERPQVLDVFSMRTWAKRKRKMLFEAMRILEQIVIYDNNG